jgi:signal transduction histidine kinase
MNRVVAWWLRGAPGDDPLQRRRAMLVQIVCALCLALLTLAEILRVVQIGPSRRAAYLIPTVVNMLLFGAALAAWRMARSGRQRLGVRILTWSCTALFAVPPCFEGMRYSAYTIIVFAPNLAIVALLLGRRELWASLAVITGGIMIGSLRDAAMFGGRTPSVPSLGVGGEAAVAFLFLVIVLDQFGCALWDSLAESLERGRELERMRSAMMRTERMNLTATLGAGVVHDMNNQLAVLMASSDLMRGRLARGEAITPDLVEAISLSSRQAATMTKRLLGLGRQRKEEPAAPVDLTAVVQDLSGLLRALLGRGVALDLALAPAPVVVRSARGRIDHILLNLVSNARDATPNGGRVTIRVSGGGDAKLEVEDTGAGILPEVRAQLFEPFFTTKEENGTGLGLASVRALAEEDGGSVAVESEIGRGSRFTVSWPRAAS